MYTIEDNIVLVSKSATWRVPNGCYYYINNKVTAEFIAQLLLASRCTCQRQDTRGSARICYRSTWWKVVNIMLLWGYSDGLGRHLEAYHKRDPFTKTNYVSYRQAIELTCFFTDSHRIVGWFRSWNASGIWCLQLPYRQNIGDSGRYQPTANFFEKIAAREPEIASLLTRAYIGMSESSSGSSVIAWLIRRGS